MNYVSASTTLTDPYRAGCEIGEALKETAPEVILLFTSITFEDNSAEFFAGLYDGLESRDVIILGGTGDGIYETELSAHYGACALGISSNGSVKWGVACQTGVGVQSAAVARRCATEALAQIGGVGAWAFVLADGISADGTAVVAGISAVLPFPFIGGLTGDDRKFTHSRIFLNGQEFEDGVAVLVASVGLPFVSQAVSGFTAIGQPGIVDEIHGKTVTRISDQSPEKFIKEQLGKPLAEADLGILALAAYLGSESEPFCLRASYRFDTLTGALELFGSIPTGATIRVSGADKEQLIAAVASGMKMLMRTGFSPAAAIVVSCAGRKWQLNSRGEEEVAAIQQAIGSHIPLIGFPSFGEIGPFLKDNSSYSPSYFHNATCVICLLGG